MRADADTHAAIQQLVERTYVALSTPGADFTDIFGNADVAIAGSGLGELMSGPDEVIPVAAGIAAQRLLWIPEKVTVWRRGEVAWAQILGFVERSANGAGGDRIPYWTTGVFGRVGDSWQWLYWGGSEPHTTPKV